MQERGPVQPSKDTQPLAAEPAAGGGPDSVTDQRAAAFLHERYGAVNALRRIAHGEWSKAYRFQRAGTGFVVRFSALEEDFAKDRIAAGSASLDLPIPPVLEMGEAFGGYYAISEEVAGTALDLLDGSRMRALLPSLFAALDAARCISLPEAGGYGVWNAGGIAPHSTWSDALLDVASDREADRTYGWKQRLASLPQACQTFQASFEQMKTLLRYCPEGRQLVHGDLLNYNVLVSGNRLAGVIDWGCSLYGDFLYDVAWFAFWAPWYPAWAGIDFEQEASRHYDAIGLAVPSFPERLRCYQIHIGLTGQAYSAFKKRWPGLEAVARRTQALASASFR